MVFPGQKGDEVDVLPNKRFQDRTPRPQWHQPPLFKSRLQITGIVFYVLSLPFLPYLPDVSYLSASAFFFPFHAPFFLPHSFVRVECTLTIPVPLNMRFGPSRGRGLREGAQGAHESGGNRCSTVGNLKEGAFLRFPPVSPSSLPFRDGGGSC